MTKPVFAIAIFEPKLHPTRLEIFEIRTTRNFKKCVLTWRPDFDVVSLGRTKSQIASAKLDHAVMQAELLQNRFGVGSERFQFCV